MPYSYSVNAIGKFALLKSLSECRFQVLTAITSDLSYSYPCNRNNLARAIGGVETETVVHYKTQHQKHDYSLIMKKLLRFT